MKEYILNRETGKIELRFEKEDYMAMSNEQKSLLKRGFLWSRHAEAWVSRCKEPNLYTPKRIAKELGFEDGGKTGERLSFVEQLERKAARAEARANRYESYAENAEKRASSLQAAFDECRKDWSWLTQPNINSSSGRAFTRQRNRIMDSYEKGFDEYRKSEYFRERAEKARMTANMADLKNPVYLDNRINEAQRDIRKLEKNMVRYEEMLHDLVSSDANSESISNAKEWLTETYERLEAVMDKEAFYQNCLDEIGGIKFSKEDLKPGYIVKVTRWGECSVVKANPKTVDIRSPRTGHVLRVNYSEIAEIISAEEKKMEEDHPYKEGEILAAYDIGGRNLIYAYKIVKTTKKTITLAEIPISEDKTPIVDAEPIKEPFTVKPRISRFNEQWEVWKGSWHLYRYTEKKGDA